MRCRGTSRRGFTLVEMLAVISIILILAAFTMVGVFSAQEAGRLANCKSNLKQIHGLIFMYTTQYGGFLPIMWHERWVGEMALVGASWGNKIDDVGINPNSGKAMPACYNNGSPTTFWTGNGEYRPIDRTGAPFLLCRSDLTGFRCDQGCFVSYCGLKKYGWWHRGSNIKLAVNSFFYYTKIQEVTNPSRNIMLAETEPGTWQFAGCGCRWQSFSDPEVIVKRHFDGGNILHFDGSVNLAKTDAEREITYWEGAEYGQNWNVGW
ncbi:type II secretion system protein [bacterium]|nr:type II secretion system protein [bacterium]